MIRHVEAKDNLSLARLIRKAFEEFDAPQKGTVYSDPTTDNLFLLFQTPGSVLWVAEIQNKVAGCCGIYPTEGLPEHCTELVKFYLAKEARGKGIGKALMQQCIDSAKKLSYTRLYLESLPQFSRAVGIYKKQGFIRLTQPLGKSEHKACTIWMLKEL